MNHRILIAAGAGLIAASMIAAPTPADACGGFFCNAGTQTPIYQAGERIVFAEYGGTVAMHIEVVYQGEPTQFGWILPVPDVPKDRTGAPLPLDQAVGISLPELFDRLQAQTNPIFRVTNTFENDSCAFDSAGGGTSDTSSADAGSAGPPSEGGEPPVVVLDEAKVGPYDAQLLEATSSDALFDWLNDNQYYQDPAAKPLLAEYVSKGWKFIGIRLQSGKQTDDLKPLVLRLGENAPCVPLRLTSIAATENMPILVFVLGPGRAIPKNYIHALVNDQALTFPGASNYVQVLSEAVNTASGRAWVTEFADETGTLGDSMQAPSGSDMTPVESAETLTDLMTATPATIRSLSGWTDILRDEVSMPAGLTGYAYDNCCQQNNGNFYCWDNGGTQNCECYGSDPNGFDYSWCEAEPEHQTTEAEFYNFIDWWLTQPGVADQVEADVAQIRDRVRDELVEPLRGIDEMFDRTTHVTRFFTTMSPDEMLRDPMFAFNPDLPMVSRDHELKTTIFSDDDCTEHVRAVYPDGSEHVFDCPGGWCAGMPVIGPVPGASALRGVQVMDETGEPLDFDPAAADEVDLILDGATPGAATLPEGYSPPAPPVVTDPGTPGGTGNPPVIVDGGSDDGPSGCSSADGQGAVALSLALLLLLGLRRRED